MEKSSILINTEGLPPAVGRHFASMLRLAQRHSLARWALAPASEAQLRVRMQPGPEEVRGLNLELRAESAHSTATLLQLPADFDAAMLRQTLDLAAVHVLRAPKQRAAAPASGLATQACQDTVYRLTHWTALASRLSATVPARVLAALSRGGVSRAWMVGPGGLKVEQADALLAELQAQGALKSHSTTARPQQVAPAGATLARLQRWINGPRTASVLPGERHSQHRTARSGQVIPLLRHAARPAQHSAPPSRRAAPSLRVVAG